MKIGKYTIGNGAPPYIIAELSANHNGSLERALAIVDEVAKAGAHALKLQTYTADTITIDAPQDEFHIRDEGSLWHGESLYDLYNKAYTPWEWHKPIFERCAELGLSFFSSPFDETAVDFLDDLGVQAFKIASFENVHLPLIEKAAKKGKPLIISTGMASVAEISEAVECARDAGCKDLLLLKCTSSYPANEAESNLSTIPELAKIFGVPVGLSDHTMGIGVAIAGVALGAVAIEKHVTMKRADGGVDSAFSMEPSELAQLVNESSRAQRAIGRVSFGPSESEKTSLQFRRSIYATKDIKEGELLSADNVRVIRPGFGLPPKFFSVVTSQRASCDIAKGTAISWEHIG